MRRGPPHIFGYSESREWTSLLAKRIGDHGDGNNFVSEDNKHHRSLLGGSGRGSCVLRDYDSHTSNAYNLVEPYTPAISVGIRSIRAS